MTTYYVLYDDVEKVFYSRDGGESSEVANARMWSIGSIDREWLEGLARTTNSVNVYDNVHNSDHDHSCDGNPHPENYKVVEIQITMKV